MNDVEIVLWASTVLTICHLNCETWDIWKTKWWNVWDWRSSLLSASKSEGRWECIPNMECDILLHFSVCRAPNLSYISLDFREPLAFPLDVKNSIDDHFPIPYAKREAKTPCIQRIALGDFDAKPFLYHLQVTRHFKRSSGVSTCFDPVKQHKFNRSRSVET